MTSLRNGRVYIYFDDPKITSADISQFVEDLKREIRNNDNIAFGHLINDIEIDDRVVKLVGYAWAVSAGTKPHEVPLRELKNWAQIKFGLDERSAWAVAKKVRGKIMRYGTYAYHDIGDALANNMMMINRIEFFGVDTEIHVLKMIGDGPIPPGDDIIEFIEKVFNDDVFDKIKSILQE